MAAGSSNEDVIPPAGAARSGWEEPGRPIRAERASSALGHYHPGLDGLRAAAVLAVLLYHGQVTWARGGFLGVSLFFTLSGFLITGVLLRNHIGPGRSLRSFWTRRARRLMPAAFLALAGVVVFGATVATRPQADALPGQIAAAATWTANWHFVMAGQSYFGLFTDPSPVQHFWSLAIEEQMYLLLPLGLLLVARRTRSRFVLGSLLAGAVLASSGWLVALSLGGAGVDRLYYGTDTRMAELLIGALLSVVLLHVGSELTTRTRRVLAGVGVVAFLGTLWVWGNVSLGDPVLWRGGLLGYSLLSCGLILGVVAGRGPLVALLAMRPLPEIGRMSYGIYLYHWPIYLWLTADRTGLDGWPLLALRVGVTFVVSILSYRFVEQPILHGASLRLPSRARLALVPAVIVAVVAAGFLTVNRSGPDPLATLRAGAASMPAGGADEGVLSVLVVPYRAGDPVVARLAEDAAHDRSLKVAVAPPFQCSGGVVATDHGKTCGDWGRTWPDLIRRHDPDVVLLYLDRWAGDDPAVLLHRPASARGEAAAQLLGSGLDLLTTRGAQLVLAAAPYDPASGGLRWFGPLNQALLRLQASRIDLSLAVGMPSPNGAAPDAYQLAAASVLRREAALHRRREGAGLLRVMVVGDSQAQSLGYGLERWASAEGRAVVWNRGIQACGVAVGGSDVLEGEAERCREVVRGWPRELRAFRPDLVLVLSSLVDVQPRVLPGGSATRGPGDPDFDRFLVRQYAHTVDVLSATGARVAWMIPPCVDRTSAAALISSSDTTHIPYLGTTIVPRLRTERPSLQVFDLARIVCPGGRPVHSVPGVDDLRPDGIHYSVPGSLWFADRYGEDLLKLAEHGR